MWSLLKIRLEAPSAKELFSLPFVFVQTLLMIACSFTSGLAGALTHRGNKSGATALFFVTLVIGVFILLMQFHDYACLYATGNGLQRSAFTTSYFNLVGLHTFHLIFAILWTLVLVIPVFKNGLTAVNVKRADLS